MTDLYQRRDKIASHSYTLHALPHEAMNPRSEPIGQLYAMFVGNVTFHRSESGMRMTCYLHLFGAEITKGTANGCGYDVATEAFAEALHRILANPEAVEALTKQGEFSAMNADVLERLRAAFQPQEWGRSSWMDLMRRCAILPAHIGG